jgi:hypothetical protein
VTIAHEGSSGIETVSTAKGVSSTTVAYTNVAAGRLALLFCTIKLGSALFSTTPPTGWTSVVDSGSGGTGTTAADVGTTRVGVWYRVLDGTETGSVTVVAAGSESMAGGMSVYSSSLGTWTAPIAVIGNDTGHGTNRSCVCGAWASALAAGDWVATAFASDTDTNPSITSPTITQTSATFGTVNTRNVRLSSSGNDTGLYTFDASVTTGNANAPTIGFTTATSQCGPGVAIRLRESASRFPPVQIDSDLLGFDPANFSGTSKDSKTFTVAVGDRFTIGVNTEDNGYTEAITNVAGGTATLGTWTRTVGTNTGSNSRVSYWTNTVSGAGTVAIRVTISGAVPSTSWWGASIRQWRNSDGFGATFAGLVQSNPLDTQQDSSTILANVSDWSVTDPGTPTWNGGLSTVTSGRDSGASHYAWALGKLNDSGVPGRTNYGLATPTFTTPTMAMIEVLGSTTSSGQSVNVNRATETAVAQPIGKAKLLAIGRVTQTAVVSPIGARRAYAVNRATETGVARAVSSAKQMSVGRVTESDIARAVAAQRSYPVGRVTETDAARPIAFSKSAAVGRVTETDAARPITWTKAKSILRVTETDAARAITSVHTRALGMVAETDVARALTHLLSRTVGMVTETDVARAIARSKTLAIGRVTETDVASLLTWTKAKAVGRVTETDAVRAILAQHVRTIGQVTETDVARALTHAKQLLLGRVTETDVVQPISFGGFSLLVGKVTSTSAARPIASRKASALNLVTETSTARGLSVVRFRPVGMVVTTATARAVTPQRAYPLGLVSTFGTARPITATTVKQILVGRAVETDIARGLTKRILLGIVSEADIAGAITPVLGEGGAKKSPITIHLPVIGITAEMEAIGVNFSTSPSGITVVEIAPVGVTMAHEPLGITLRD